MATVYLGRLVGAAGFRRLVAIKRLHPHLARDREFIDMFLDEARLAARIHHPNVVPILEVGESDKGGYYLVMEYIEGDTAARLFARSAQNGKKVPFDVGIRIAVDTLNGLHAAHEMTGDDGQPLHIVHRDVSPQNILVGIDGTSRITDFGVARAASRLSTTRSGQLKGKLAYMAPEQAKGAAVDRRADVFAMGIVLWETLAFKRLFKGEGEADTLNRVLYEPIPTLKSAQPSIPAAIEAVVMKAIERDPDKRWKTAAEFAEALEQTAAKLQQLGSTKDVAQCLDGVMGLDLTEAREAVRTWLAQSQPSMSQARQRIHEGLRGDPSNPRIVPSAPESARAAIDLENAKRGALAMAAGSSGSFPNLPKTDISSVSSAVIQVPPLHGAQAAAPRGGKGGLIAAALGVLLVAMIGVAVFQQIHYRRGLASDPAGSQGSAHAPAAGTVDTRAKDPAPPDSAVVTAAAPKTASVASSAASASSAHAATTAAPTARRPGAPAKTGAARPPVDPTGAPTGAQPARPTATVAPDNDISHNPYR